MSALRFHVWSDYLCPWCYVAAERWRRLEEAYADEIRVVWRAYLLRPSPRPRSRESLERFRAYTRSWQRPAAEKDAPQFVPWQGAEGPPSHSLPAHRVAKAARAHGVDAFARLHQRLLRAYFAESRDVSALPVLRELWRDVGLPEERFADHLRSELLDEVLEDHRCAQEAGATGVPAVRLEGNDAILVGAQPAELYERWIERLLAGRRPQAVRSH